MLRLIACDWNGTLFRDTLEEAFFLGFCRREFLRAVRGRELARVWDLSGLALRCYRRYLLARLHPEQAPEHVARIVEMINEKVFRGVPRANLDAFTAEYARRIQPRIDRRLIGPLRAVRRESGVPLAIVSLGCREGIEAALARAGCPADAVLANQFRFRGEAVEEFAFTIRYNKARVLSDFLAERGIAPAEVMYVGDSPQDEGCLRLVGMPVLSFWATREHKKLFARRHEAFVPQNESEFEDYIRRALA